MLRVLGLLLTLSIPAVCELIDRPNEGVRLERGFRIQLVADDSLAPENWSMVLNPKGEIVVWGPRYIRTLLDTDKDGRADKALEFATTSGANGLDFGESGKQVVVIADGALSEYRDDNLDGVADGKPRRILPIAAGKYGGHAVKRGPDGWWWVMAGYDSGLHAGDFDLRGMKNLDSSAPAIRAGALIRMSPDFQRKEVFADGLLNCYDFDFNEHGNAFTCDSDFADDYFLPWYSGCRVYHIQSGRSHGWRLTERERGFRIPDYMPETVPALADLGRGLPTSIRCYQGRAFPAYYRGGLFVGDMLHGRLTYFPIVPSGETFTTKPETFLEALDEHTFSVTSIVETQEGALLVSVGGPAARGAIYRIEAENASGVTAPVLLIPPREPAPPMLQKLADAQAKLGGWKLEGASAVTFVPYEPAKPDGLQGQEKADAASLAQQALISLDERVRMEAARLLAMLEDTSAVSAETILGAITRDSHPTNDFHYLACLARMKLDPDAMRTAAIAKTILDFDRKLEADRHPKPNWPARMKELVERLTEKNPGLAELLARKP